MVDVLATWKSILLAALSTWWGQVQSLEGAIGALVLMLAFLSKPLGKKVERLLGWSQTLPTKWPLLVIAIWFGWLVMFTTHKRLTTVPAPPSDVSQLAKDTKIGALEHQLGDVSRDLNVERQRAADERDRHEKREAELQKDIQRLSAQLEDKRDVTKALQAIAGIRDEWQSLQRKAAQICVKAQIGTMPDEFRALSQKTRELLTSLGYPEYVPDFLDYSTCSGGDIPRACERTFNSEAVSWFQSARCRIANLNEIVNRLRTRIGQ